MNQVQHTEKQFIASTHDKQHYLQKRKTLKVLIHKYYTKANAEKHFETMSGCLDPNNIVITYMELMRITIHQIFFACAAGLNMLRLAAKTGEYHMIYPIYVHMSSLHPK